MGMPVGELLARTSSKELTEWMAYEQATGPLDNSYSDDLLAAIHEVLQFLCRIQGTHLDRNPARHLPKKVERPRQVFLSGGDRDDEVLSSAEFDREFRE